MMLSKSKILSSAEAKAAGIQTRPSRTRFCLVRDRGERSFGSRETEAARAPQNRGKSGRERNAKRRQNPCEQRMISNQHPSPRGEGCGDTLNGAGKRVLSLKKRSSGLIKTHHFTSLRFFDEERPRFHSAATSFFAVEDNELRFKNQKQVEKVFP